MHVMSLDLEYNQPLQEILQIGVAVGDTETGEILEAYEGYVNSREHVHWMVKKITKITSEIAANAPPLSVTYRDVYEIFKKYKCEPNPIVWGGPDHNSLRNQIITDSVEMPWIFSEEHIDAQHLYHMYRLSMRLNVKGSLKKALQSLGDDFIGRVHSAKDDAINTFRIYKMVTDLAREQEGVYDECKFRHAFIFRL